MKFPIEIGALKKLFIASDSVRNKTKYDTIYTWNELGILAHSKDGKMVEILVLNLEQEDFNFSLKQNFQRQFYFNNEDILS